MNSCPRQIWATGGLAVAARKVSFQVLVEPENGTLIYTINCVKVRLKKLMEIFLLLNLLYSFIYLDVTL